jgi:hypothetical protein
MKRALLTLSVLALLAGCSSSPDPVVQAATEPTLGSGDSLGLSLHRTDRAVTEAAVRNRSFAAHPD